MTLENFVRGYLFQNGMFESDVQKVMELAKQDEVLKDTISERWNDSLEGYPPLFKNLLIVSINAIAVKYIDENCPLAWYRPMFAGDKS